MKHTDSVPVEKNLPPKQWAVAGIRVLYWPMWKDLPLWECRILWRQRAALFGPWEIRF